MNYATSYPRTWRLFFALSVALVVWSIGYDLVQRPWSLAPMQIVSAALGVGGLVPLHGYVWQRIHHPRWLWRALFWFTLVAMALTLVAGVITIVGSKQWSFLPLLAALVIPGLVYLFALEQYVNKSSHIWQSPQLAA